jgi:hypothetical protein
MRSLALVAVSGICMVAPGARAEDTAQACPAGQIAATRIEYEGQYNLDPTVHVFNLHAIAPNVGYTKRTVLVGNNGYYKEATEGTLVVVKENGPGKPVPMPGITMYARELPSRFVIIETPQQKLVYDEKGDPENRGTKRNKPKKVSAEDERMIVGGLQTALAPSADKVQILGKATYAGIPCEVRQFLMPGDSVCIASIRGQYVTLAEELKSPARPQPSTMQAKTKADVCVSTKEFEAPAHVRFE